MIFLVRGSLRATYLSSGRGRRINPAKQLVCAVSFKLE